jgi:hypothetical protein
MNSLIHKIYGDTRPVPSSILTQVMKAAEEVRQAKERKKKQKKEENKEKIDGWLPCCSPHFPSLFSPLLFSSLLFVCLFVYSIKFNTSTSLLL